MKNYLEIGPSPIEEDCVQVGEENYADRAREECNRFVQLIREELGKEPEGARLAVKSFPHDFGTYFEVVCWYDEDLPETVEYAFRCESDAPVRWNS